MTVVGGVTDTTRFRGYGLPHLDAIAERYGLSADLRETTRTIAQVLPFRVNDYVLENLIDWAAVPDDPMFRMTFPQRGMLPPDDENLLGQMMREGRTGVPLTTAVREIQGKLNAHPSGQRELNVPTLDGVKLPGMQHKYRETVLYFPAHGQTCHAYCGYCFRWAQFTGEPDLRFAAPNADRLVAYLRRQPDVCDVLVTGGDPMVMSADRLRSHLTPILRVPTVNTIRIGTKSVAYWPYRYLTDRDADDTLRLFEEIVATGRQLAIMAHFSHPRELGTEAARIAVARIRATGATVYCQAPMLAHVNDDARTWGELWKAQLRAGMVPYYLFVERDTGPHEFFKVPLARAVEIFHTAVRTLPGLARTIRGPVMSATPGKVSVDGVEQDSAGRFFQLRMLQARNSALVGRPFRAHYSTTASWLNELALDRTVPPDIADALRDFTSARPEGIR